MRCRCRMGAMVPCTRTMQLLLQLGLGAEQSALIAGTTGLCDLTDLTHCDFTDPL